MNVKTLTTNIQTPETMPLTMFQHIFIFWNHWVYPVSQWGRYFFEKVSDDYIYTRRNDTTWNILSPSFPIIRNIPTLGLGNLRYFFKSQTITTVYPMATSQQKFKATGVFLTRNVQGIASRNRPSMRGPRALMFEASWDDGCWVPKKYRGDKYPQAT